MGGGAMLMRKDDFTRNNCNVQSAWRDGGYSDDMLAAACAREGGRTVATPPQAIFPNVLSGRITFLQAWHFLVRQMFVLNTYASRWGCVKNRLLHLAYGLGNLLVVVGFWAASLAIFGVCMSASETSVRTFAFLGASVYFVMLILAMIAEKKHLHDCVRLTVFLSPEAAPIATSHISFVVLLV